MDRADGSGRRTPAVMGLPSAPPGGEAGRALDFRIGEGFGDAPPDNIRAVIRSAAETIWRHCPDTRWQVPGFFIFQSKDAPITLFDHHADGRIAIGLTTQGTCGAQFAYQFAHELCHALAGRANDWRRPWIREREANHWLEESLCQAASLFAIRAMAAGRRLRALMNPWSQTVEVPFRLKRAATAQPRVTAPPRGCVPSNPGQKTSPERK